MTAISRLSSTIIEVNAYLDFVEGVGYDFNDQVKQHDY